MSKYPEPMDRRWPAALGDFMRRLRTLESRTMGIDSGFPLMALPGVISPAYASGDPTVQVNGAVDASGNPVYTGPWQHLASYTPAAGDKVLLMPVVSQQAYVVLGKLA